MFVGKYTHPLSLPFTTRSGVDDEAYLIIRRVIEIDPKSANLYNNLGNAIACFERVLAINGEYKAAIDDLCILCPARSWSLATAVDAARGDILRAVELAKRATPLRPRDANNWNKLGVAQYRAGRMRAAITAFVTAEYLPRREGNHLIEHDHRMFFAMAYWKLGEKERLLQGFSWVVPSPSGSPRRNDA